MTKSLSKIVALMAALAMTGCDSAKPTKPVTVSIIGQHTRLVDPSMGLSDQSSRLMMASTAQGLVAFDSSGQIEPALAERWNIINNGQNYIFRISDTTWNDGSAVTSVEVAQILKRALAARARDGSGPMLSSVESVIAMTPRVIEIRLSAPLPGLLQLLAQPDMVISKRDSGTGPYRLHSQRDGITRLRLIPTPDEDGELPDQAAQEPYDMRLRGENAARAITRFINNGSNLVLGGRFQDLPLVSVTDPGNGRFKVDPASGLFGLRVLRTDGALGDKDIRIALSIALDREKSLGLIRGESWEPSLSILPRQLDSASPPSALALLQGKQNDRLANAKRLIGGKKVTVRLALPSGPGSDLLFASLAQSWQAIGVETEKTKAGQPADLALIDEVAPVNSALWYLGRLGCQTRLPCSQDADASLIDAVSATNGADRAAAIAKADAQQTAAHYYFPLAQPLRWSLVDPDLAGWRDNAAGAHPLLHLRPVAR